MKKIFLLVQVSLLLFCLSVQAQSDCTMIGIPNSTILSEALKDLSEKAWETSNFELFNIKMIEIDNLRSDPRVNFQIQQSNQISYMNYTQCGEKLTFSQIKTK